MDEENAVVRERHCCLSRVSDEAHRFNYTTIMVFRAATECFPPNTTKSDIFKFVSMSKEHISAEDCFPLISVPIDKCSIPTTAGNITYAVFLFILMAIILATNSFYCLAIFRSRVLLRHPSHRFILSLAVSDLLVALVAMPIIINLTLHNGAFCSSRVLCHLAYFVDHLVFLSCIMILLAIGIDRYLAVSKPYKYQQLMNQTRSKFMIVSIWVLSCLFGLTANVDWNSMSFQGVGINQLQVCFTRNPKYTGTVLVTCFFVPVILMGFIYYRIFRETLKHTAPIATIGKLRDIDVLESSESSNDARTRKVATQHTLNIGNRPRQRRQHVTCFPTAKLRALRVLIIVYGTFVLCWLPGNVVTLLNMFCPGIVVLEIWQYRLLNEILPLSNSAINVFIYAVMNEDCKKAMQKLLCCSLVQENIQRKRLDREKKRRESEKSVAVTFQSTDV